MCKNKQRTGILSLEDVNSITLSTITEDVWKSASIMPNPQILVDAIEIKTANRNYLY